MAILESLALISDWTRPGYALHTLCRIATITGSYDPKYSYKYDKKLGS